MAIVARLLPRNWDGGRLLRFLTGLALLALTFVAPAVAVAEPVPAAAAVSVAGAPVSERADSTAASDADVTQLGEIVVTGYSAPAGTVLDAAVVAPAVAEVGASSAYPSGWGSRAPPVA
jgi:hypothetical protein